MFVRPNTPLLRREAGLLPESPVPRWVWPVAMAFNVSWFLWDVGLTAALWPRLNAMTLAQAQSEASLIPSWWSAGMLVHLLAAWWLPALMAALAWGRPLPGSLPPRDVMRARVWLWFWPLIWIDVTWWLLRGLKTALLAAAPAASGVHALTGDLPLDPAGPGRLVVHFTLGPLNAFGLSIFMLLLASRLAVAWRRPLGGFAVAAITAFAWYVAWHFAAAPVWREAMRGQSPALGELFLLLEGIALWALIALLHRRVERDAAQTGGHPGGAGGILPSPRPCEP